MPNIKVKYDPLKLKELSQSIGLIHCRYGDLMRPDAVNLPDFSPSINLYKEHKPYFIHLSITNRCNAGCKGCVNSQITDLHFRDGLDDTDPVRDAEAINKIISTLEDDVIICLYGGEPLLELDKIRSLIKEVEGHAANKKSGICFIQTVRSWNGC